MQEEQLYEELNYINSHYEFSQYITKDLQDFIIDSGLAFLYDGDILMLTDLGESEIGINNEDSNFQEESYTIDDLEDLFDDNNRF